MGDTKQVAAEALEAFNAHDEAGIRATYADDVVFEAPGDARTEGAEETTGYAMAWLNAFPDAKLTVHDEIYDGEWCVQRFTFDGTHQDTLTGPGGDIPATNRRLSGRGLQMFCVRDGKIVEGWSVFDTAAMTKQLGFTMVPADLTSGQFKSGPAVEDIFRTVTTGLSGTPMPSYRDAFPDEDRWALAYYVLALSAYKDPLTGQPLKIADTDRAALDDLNLKADTPENAYVPSQGSPQKAAALGAPGPTAAKGD